MTTSPLTDLPYEVLLNISKYCPLKELGALSETCKKLRQVTADASLWKPPSYWGLTLKDRSILMLNASERKKGDIRANLYACYREYDALFARLLGLPLEGNLFDAHSVIAKQIVSKDQGFLNASLLLKLIPNRQCADAKLGREILLLIRAGALPPSDLYDCTVMRLIELKLPEASLKSIFQTNVFKPSLRDVKEAYDQKYSWELITEILARCPVLTMVSKVPRIDRITLSCAIAAHAPKDFYTLFFSKCPLQPKNEWEVSGKDIPDDKLIELLDFFAVGAGISPRPTTLYLHPDAISWALKDKRPEIIYLKIIDLLDAAVINLNLSYILYIPLLEDHAPSSMLKRLIERCPSNNLSDILLYHIQAGIRDNRNTEKLLVLISAYEGLFEERFISLILNYMANPGIMLAVLAKTGTLSSYSYEKAQALNYPEEVLELIRKKTEES